MMMKGLYQHKPNLKKHQKQNQLKHFISQLQLKLRQHMFQKYMRENHIPKNILIKISQKILRQIQLKKQKRYT